MEPEKAWLSQTTTLKGIGPKTEVCLSNKGLTTVFDCLHFIPKRYDDTRDVWDVDEANAKGNQETTFVIKGLLETRRFVRRGKMKWIELKLASLHTKEWMSVRFFNAFQSALKKYEVGSEMIVSGKLKKSGNRFSVANPDLIYLKTPEGKVSVDKRGVLPRYAKIQGVSSHLWSKAIHDAISNFGHTKELEFLPSEIIKKHQLATKAEALKALHSPSDTLPKETLKEMNKGESPWHKRLAYEDLLLLALQIELKRHAVGGNDAPVCTPLALDELCSSYPFELTRAQKRSVGEVMADMGTKRPMNRLLQGDVGSGKTAVAFAAVRLAAASEKQSLWMAPTSILAEQHARTLGSWCDKSDIRWACLNSKMSTPEKEKVLTGLADGTLDLVVGTHSLLSEKVMTKSLGVVVIDEQHRFGVAQRALLRSKSDKSLMPHMLLMTATPIPRTLTLSTFGHLDCSVLDEKPPGRIEPRTQVLKGVEGRTKCYQALRRRIEANEKAFVVCPLVSPSTVEGRGHWKNVESVYKELTHWYGEEMVSVCHGQQTQDERELELQKFMDGDTKVLLATTVIEVGVDMPDVNIMVIEDANHFGLATLHQLRGRVGRGTEASECVLLAGGKLNEEGAERLEIMVESNDGFVIAEKDLDMRGPGDLLGLDQSGTPLKIFGSYEKHMKLFELAKQDAKEILKEDPTLSLSKWKALKSVFETRMMNKDGYFELGG